MNEREQRKKREETDLVGETERENVQTAWCMKRNHASKERNRDGVRQPVRQTGRRTTAPTDR